MAWFFERKINRNSVKLKTLRGEKKKIIEKVMDKETYKVALEILNRFAENVPKPPQQDPYPSGKFIWLLIEMLSISLIHFVILQFNELPKLCQHDPSNRKINR